MIRIILSAGALEYILHHLIPRLPIGQRQGSAVGIQYAGSLTDSGLPVIGGGQEGIHIGDLVFPVDQVGQGLDVFLIGSVDKTVDHGEQLCQGVADGEAVAVIDTVLLVSHPDSDFLSPFRIDLVGIPVCEGEFGIRQGVIRIQVDLRRPAVQRQRQIAVLHRPQAAVLLGIDGAQLVVVILGHFGHFRRQLANVHRSIIQITLRHGINAVFPDQAAAD